MAQDGYYSISIRSTNDSGKLKEPVTQTSVEIQEQRRDVRLISNFETMLHFLKGNIGTGLFAIPVSFLNSGIWVGTILMPLIAFICTHCMHLLLRSAVRVQEKMPNVQLSYADVTEVAFQSGPPTLAKFAQFAKSTVNTFICITQFGFCCVYMVFISSNLKQVVDYYVPTLQWDVRIYMCIIAIPLVFLNWIRDLRVLAPVSFIGNLLMALSVLAVFYYVLKDQLPPLSERPAFGTWQGLALFFGTAIYAFEGIALVLPLQQQMTRPDDFAKWNGILNTGMLIVTSFVVVLGFFGYLKYGPEIEGSITLNLPQQDLLAQLVKIFMVLSILSSFAMQFYVPIPILWPTLLNYVTRYVDNPLIAELVFRTFLVLAIHGLATAIPRIDLFVPLIGAIGSSFLALVFPPLLDMLVKWPNLKKKTIVSDTAILIFGLVGFTAGTYASIGAVVEAFGPKTNA